MKHTRRILSYFVSILLGFCMFLPVSAQSGTVDLTTTVPAESTLQVVIIGAGTVTVGDEKLTSTGYISVLRHGEVQVVFTPAFGYRLAMVMLNGKDITSSLQNNKVSLKNLNLDSTLSVTFQKENKEQTNPATGDQLWYWLMLMALSVLFVVSNRKRIISP